MRMAREKVRDIGQMLIDKASWLEQIICRGKSAHQDENTTTQNYVLQSNLFQRQSTRSKFSRYKNSPGSELNNANVVDFLTLSPNREEECSPSLWGYDSVSLTVSDSE